MYLKNIQLANFKNYSEAHFDFSDKVNAIVGSNGSGKTNLLDAIHYLTLCKSYFLSQDAHAVKFGEDFFAIHGEFHGFDDERSRKVSCIYKPGGRKVVKLNQKEYERISDHIGQFPLIMVAPYDNDVIHEGSEIRRKFFDMMISQFDKEYLHNLISYQKILAQRNILLKQFWENRHCDSALLQIYNDQLVPYGEAIHTKRAEFISTLILVFQKHYDHLSDSKESVSIVYRSELATKPFAESLAAQTQADFNAGHTTVGIHKDDYEFLMNDRSVKRFSSQGQQKSFALALKLSQFDYIYIRRKLKPILLLDDIFDKLDESRISQLLHLVGNEHFGQVFLSDTDEDRIKKILSKHGIAHKVFRVGDIAFASQKG